MFKRKFRKHICKNEVGYGRSLDTCMLYISLVSVRRPLGSVADGLKIFFIFLGILYNCMNTFKQ